MAPDGTKRAPHRPWYSDDRVGWAVFAVGVLATFGVFRASVAFEGHGDIPAQRDRKRLLGNLPFAAGAFALSGPMAVTLVQSIIGRVACPAGKKQKVAGFECLQGRGEERERCELLARELARAGERGFELEPDDLVYFGLDEGITSEEGGSAHTEEAE